jgi:hypothetical protein
MVKGLSMKTTGSTDAWFLRMSMRSRLVITGILLFILIGFALVSGGFRLGPSNLSPRALKTASNWVSKLHTLSDRSEELASSIVKRLDFSKYLTPEEREMGSVHTAIQQSVQNQITGACQQRGLVWEFDDPIAMNATTYQLISRTSMPTIIRVEYVLDRAQKTVEASGDISISIIFIIDADQKKIISWQISQDTTINLERKL